MSNPDEPDKKRPQPTVAWNPDDLPNPDEGSAEAGAAEESDAGTAAPHDDSESPAPRQSQPTVAWNPNDGAAGEPTSPPAAESAATGGVADEPDEDPLVGTLLRDKWRVLKRLGAGSFGTVYKVEDVKGGWIEALKILGVDRLVGAEAETMRKRFLREAQIMKRLGTESAHIVGLSTYEEDLEAGLIYFLMEYVEGKSLGDAVQEEGPFTVERTIHLGLQICDALIAAHEGPEGVVHRDMKLENVMLTTDRAGGEIAKVLDFGIAKLAERETDSRLTTVGTLGTPGYAAPEQLRAEDVDARTDLFAFGVILYALLTGRDPWLGNPAGEAPSQIYELMVATERGDVRPFSEAGEGMLPIGPVAMPFRVRVNETEVPGAVEDLRAAGLEVDTSWEVARLIDMAASAQSETRYFGSDGNDVRSYAQRVATLEPASPEARSLLLKVAERMAWDAEAARQDGSPDVADALVQECLSLVPEHARCVEADGGS